VLRESGWISSKRARSAAAKGGTRREVELASELSPIPPDKRLLALIEGFLQTLPRESRVRLGPAFSYVESLRCARGHIGRDRSWPVEMSKAFVEKHMSAAAFKALLDPARPIDDPWVIEQAAALCEEVLRSRARVHKLRYGELVEASAARAIGWFALIELSKRMWTGEEVENPHGLLRRIIEGDVGRLEEAAMRQTHPGAYAIRRFTKREEKRLRHEHPEMEALERWALAAKLAHEHLGRFYNFLNRVADESVDSVIDEGADLSGQVFSEQIVGWIDRLVADTRRYTDTDRDAWVRFKAAGFRGADIDWTGACSRRTGSQRLQALFRKLRRDLEDWR
jgi:hypothetical protein